mmetsp:Transcript_145945/g.254649  ORF Transcript_145945/g.254649 Transcript_145945/m.254649 type:complete len:843 (+) Transcript_145945:96-2624(+)
MAAAPLPREIIKWLQSLDLSFVVKNPKRDLANGYLCAEIVSRYYPKDINIVCYENGTRLAAKVDNWEQLFRHTRKTIPQITKQDIDPVIHCAPGAAEFFLLKLHQVLTKRTIRPIAPQPADTSMPPAYMRDTASVRLKDHEISRVQDRVERTIKAIDVLGMYHEERRMQKTLEAPLLLREERRRKMRRPYTDRGLLNSEELHESVQIDEVRVKSLTIGDTKLPGGGTQRRDQPQAAGTQNSLMKKVATPRSAVGALAGMQVPALFVKPAADIMRPLVSSIISESEELSKVLDSHKDIVVSFMEQCRDAVPEDISVRVFETLANRAQLLVDTLTKSPPEFWKVWSTFYPALTDFKEQSPVFGTASFLFKRIGDLMRDADPTLTQQLITEVGLPSLSKEMTRSPEKREALCEIIYSYTQEDTLNHLLVLRALKDKVADLSVYISCLACFISRDAQLSLLDEHLLDLYIYYALIAMQSPQPKIRVAGLSILCTITMCSSQHHSVVALIGSFAELATDDWWEVQAQLLLLSAHLLSKITAGERQDMEAEDDASTKVDSPSAASTAGRDHTMTPLAGGGDAEIEAGVEDVAGQLLDIIGRLFVVSNSKNVLQVGLSALVHLLPDFTNLQPMFVAVLLDQPMKLRRRLLQAQSPEEAGSSDGSKRIYAYGSVRMYEEKHVSSVWPHLDMAKTFVKQLEVSPLDHWEIEHMEVFLACLPDEFSAEEADEVGGWLDLFKKVHLYIFAALVDPKLHLHSTEIIKRFWLCNVERIATRSIEASKKTLVKALWLLYRDMDGTTVDEAAVLEFLRDLCNRGDPVQFEVINVVESFREAYPTEYQNSNLCTLLDS